MTILTNTAMPTEDTVKALVDSGLKDMVKVIIGGAQLSEEFARHIGADDYSAD